MGSSGCSSGMTARPHKALMLAQKKPVYLKNPIEPIHTSAAKNSSVFFLAADFAEEIPRENSQQKKDMPISISTYTGSPHA